MKFLENIEQANELIRLWKFGLQMQEAIEMKLTPIPREIAQLEGRPYFKIPLFPCETNKIKFLLKEVQTLQIEINQEILFFLQYLHKKNKKGKQGYRRLEVPYYIGFPSILYLDQQGKKKLTTIFRFPLSSINVPQIENLEITSKIQESPSEYLELVQEKFEEGTFPYWLDEYFLSEHLGIQEEELQKIRHDFEKQSLSIKECLRRFIQLFRNKNSIEHINSTEDIPKDELLFRELACVFEEYSNIQIYPYGILYEHQGGRVTRQLQNDLNSILEDRILSSLYKEYPNHPALTYLLGSKEASNQKTQEILGQYTKDILTDSQEKVLINSQYLDFSVAQGPPGTGKTHLIRNIVSHRIVKHALSLKSTSQWLWDSKWSTLITSTNNRAVDNALEEMELPNLLPIHLRIGSWIILTDSTTFFLDEYLLKISQRNIEEEKEQFYKKQDELKKYLESHPNLSSENRYHAYILSREIIDAWVGSNQVRVIDFLQTLVKEIRQFRGLPCLRKAKNMDLLLTIFPVFGSTLLSIRNIFPMQENLLGMILVDEAGQCLPSYLLPVLLRAKKALLIGDIHQLEPISHISMQDWFSLLSKRRINLDKKTLYSFIHSSENIRSSQHIALESTESVFYLKEHFRCQPSIIKISIELCNYDLTIYTPPQSEICTTLADSTLLYKNTEFEEKKYGSSWYNPKEADVCVQFLQQLFQQGVQPNQIALITPYRGQLNYLHHILKKNGIFWKTGESDFNSFKNYITTGTVHRFQGGEREIVLFSSVMHHEEPIFMNSRVNLINVAISRAKQHFVFFGNIAALTKGPYTNLLKKHLLEYGKELT